MVKTRHPPSVSLALANDSVRSSHACKTTAISRDRPLPNAIIVNFDGTLLTSQQYLSPRNQQAIERCRTLGIPVVVATSRPDRSVHRFLGIVHRRCQPRRAQWSLSDWNGPFTGHYAQMLAAPLVLAIVEMVCTRHPAVRFTIEPDGRHFATNAQTDAQELQQPCARLCPGMASDEN